MSIFENSVIAARQQRAAQNLASQDAVVVVAAGEPIQKPGGQDQTFPFVPHPEYYWLTGSRRPGGIAAYVPGEGWTHFVQPATHAERLWEGEPEVPSGKDVGDFAAWLQAHGGKTWVNLGAGWEAPGVQLSTEENTVVPVRDLLDKARRIKDDAEMALFARAVRATVAGHRRAREVIAPGITERRIQVELEAEMFRAGADTTGYGTIVGAGTHAAVLHFSPGDREVQPTDLVLVDAGAELHGYTADVTRVYSAEGSFTPEQQSIYDIVLAAQLAGIEKCVPGVEWHDVHRTCAEVIAQGLIDLGILKGTSQQALESEAIALFFPHGVGHMLGLGVRDVGGRVLDREAGRKSCGAAVRVDLPLEAGFLMTVEPGLYFVPPILDDPDNRSTHADSVNWDSLDRWRPVGGVRIEDDVLVTAQGPEVTTAEIPK